MKYLLDTDICVNLMNGRNDTNILKNLHKIEPDNVGISVLTLSELVFGAMNSSQPDVSREVVDVFCASLMVCYFDEEAAWSYGALRADLRRKGEPVGAMDMLIAAHALALDVTLVTNNEKEFKRVPNLRVENWVKKP